MERHLREQLSATGFSASPVRSRMMSAVAGRGNRTTEVALRFALVRHGVRGWVMHPGGLRGRPDFYFPKKRIAVFVDGCFWHGCNSCGHVPSKNLPFWSAKLARNRQRDQTVQAVLEAEGIRVLRFWEHELQADRNECVARVKRLLVATSKKSR
jgi:DNA mismatch endonuclease (patch repair protein)